MLNGDSCDYSNNTKHTQKVSSKLQMYTIRTPFAIATNDAIREISACKPWCCMWQRPMQTTDRPTDQTFRFCCLSLFRFFFVLVLFVSFFARSFRLYFVTSFRWIWLFVAAAVFSVCELSIWLSSTVSVALVERQFTAAAIPPLSRQRNQRWLMPYIQFIRTERLVLTHW